jgi:hypothetical protein
MLHTHTQNVDRGIMFFLAKNLPLGHKKKGLWIIQIFLGEILAQNHYILRKKWTKLPYLEENVLNHYI